MIFECRVINHHPENKAFAVFRPSVRDIKLFLYKLMLDYYCKLNELLCERLNELILEAIQH